MVSYDIKLGKDHKDHVSVRDDEVNQLLECSVDECVFETLYSILGGLY